MTLSIPAAVALAEEALRDACRLCTQVPCEVFKPNDAEAHELGWRVHVLVRSRPSRVILDRVNAERDANARSREPQLAALVLAWAPVVEAARRYKMRPRIIPGESVSGELAELYDAVSAFDGCDVSLISSRSCEQGTRGCTVHHAADALDK